MDAGANEVWEPLSAAGADAPVRSIFGEDWWFDAAAPGAWERVTVARDGVPVGEMSFVRSRRMGMTFLGMPAMTRTVSPKLRLSNGKPVTRRVNAVSIIAELVEKLPPHDRFETMLAPNCPSVQGFLHCDFAVTHTYTYRSPLGLGPKGLMAAAHQKTRNVIVKARETLEIERSSDLERFIRLHAARFGADNLVDYAVLRRVYAAAHQRGQAEIVFARREGLGDVAAVILLSDQDAVYFWTAARHALHPSGGANSLLIFEAMKIADTKNVQLDLDGYASAQGSVFLMKFGLQPVVRPFVNRSNRLWKCAHLANMLLRPNREDRHYRV